jgi:hypothetical protein
MPHKSQILVAAGMIMNGMDQLHQNAVHDGWKGGTFTDLVQAAVDYAPFVNELRKVCEEVAPASVGEFHTEVSQVFGAWYGGKLLSLDGKTLPNQKESFAKLRKLAESFYGKQPGIDIVSMVANVAKVQEAAEGVMIRRTDMLYDLDPTEIIQMRKVA